MQKFFILPAAFLYDHAASRLVKKLPLSLSSSTEVFEKLL